MDYAFLHNTGDKDAKVTFLTMVDNSSGSMVATAVQKKGHDKFVERVLLKILETFEMTGEMVLQTDKEMGPIDVAKHVAGERIATTVIRQTHQIVACSPIWTKTESQDDTLKTSWSLNLASRRSDSWIQWSTRWLCESGYDSMTIILLTSWWTWTFFSKMIMTLPCKVLLFNLMARRVNLRYSHHNHPRHLKWRLKRRRSMITS